MSKVKTTIHFDKEWEEYQVRVWINNKLDEAKTYHTDDKDDAKDTQRVMNQEIIDHPERYQTVTPVCKNCGEPHTEGTGYCVQCGKKV